MTYRSACLLFALLSCALLASEKPNIVFVITDDQGYGDLGFTGNPIIKTPNIDALAAEAISLADFHAAPTCSPTRCSLLTGHWTNRTGVWHTINGRSMLRENEITLGQLLKDNGYETGMFGKWHLGDHYPYRPEDRGFTEVYRHGGGGVGQTPDYWDNSYFDGKYFQNGKIAEAKGFCTDVFFEEGNKFIKKCAESKKPFFAYISTNAPHGPLHCPQEYMDLYSDQNANIAAFYGMITNIDDNVAKTRQLLEDLGIKDNTIFIFTTDNGTAYGAKVYNAGMRGQKGSQYDGGHRVPFLLHWPAQGMDKKRDVQTITHIVDIVPTLLDLTGSRKPDTLKFDGLSLRPLLSEGQQGEWPDRMLITDSQRVVDPVKWRKSAVMSQQYRLIDGKELYDITSDPGQANNIAGKHPEKVEEMRAFYEAWWAELEPTFSQTTEIYLGAPGHERVVLNSHDWIGSNAVPWNQGHIRKSYGEIAEEKKLTHESHWAVKVVTPGRYEISVRRWPEEIDHPIIAGLPAGEPVPGATAPFRETPGMAIPTIGAFLRIDGKNIARRRLQPEDTEITFTVNLSEGSHQIAPIFAVPNGEIGCYYAIVSKLAE